MANLLSNIGLAQYQTTAFQTEYYENALTAQRAYMENNIATAHWANPLIPSAPIKLISKSKTVAKLIKEEFKNLSSKPIVKEIMAGLISLKKEQVSQVVNEMLAI